MVKLWTRNTDAYYRSLSVGELKNAIAKLVTEVDGYVMCTTRAARGRLLPALLALRAKVKRGEWQQQVLRSIGLRPATVRKWRQRERAATAEIAALVGGAVQRRHPGKREAIPESEAQALVAAGARLAKAVLRGKSKYARELAAAYLGEYEQP